MQKILFSRLDYDARDGLYYLEEQPFTGIAFTAFDDGQERALMEYRAGLRWGRTQEWYRSRQPMVDSHFVRGVLHGYAREWHRDGRLAEEGEYEYGIALWEKKWGADGNLEEEYRLQESDRNYETLLDYRKLYGQRE